MEPVVMRRVGWRSIDIAMGVQWRRVSGIENTMRMQWRSAAARIRKTAERLERLPVFAVPTGICFLSPVSFVSFRRPSGRPQRPPAFRPIHDVQAMYKLPIGQSSL